MKVRRFDFKFKHQGESINASCLVVKPHKKYQYRVSVKKEDGNDLILVMYKVDEKDQTFFWFPLDKKKNELAKSICKKLITHVK